MIPFVLDSSPGTPPRHWTRRQVLQIGGLAGCGLLGARSAWGKETSPAALAPGFGRARSVILFFCNGGQSHIDTWDPKPGAPEEVRGEFRAIDTAVPGLQLAETMPHLARLADRLTVVRSMCHDDLDHGSAVYLSLTGRFHARKSSNPRPSPADVPTAGAVLKRVRPAERFPYTAVHVNGPALAPVEPVAGQFAGLLGADYEPMVVGDVMNSETAAPGMTPQPGLPPVRLQRRQRLLDSLDAYLRESETQATHGGLQSMSAAYERAFEVLASPSARNAFRLNEEPAAVRDRYGRYATGQATLLARRLVEAGTPLVTVFCNQLNRGQDQRPGDIDACGWDTHNDIFDALREQLMPRFDWTFSALLDDLDQRGLLDSTLVVCFGEFGRAPRVALERKFAGSSPGRKHWASAYSVAFAGAGVSRGAVFGASDKLGAVVDDRPVSPEDLIATVFHALGVDPGGHYFDALERPFPISTGRPITGLYRS